MCEPIYYRNVKDLDALSSHAVLYDHNNQVWQKHHSHPNATMSTAGVAWYLPGSELPHESADIALPARLLDDGL